MWVTLLGLLPRAVLGMRGGSWERTGDFSGFKEPRVGVLLTFPRLSSGRSDSSSSGKGEVQGSHLQPCSHQVLLPFFSLCVGNTSQGTAASAAVMKCN